MKTTSSAFKACTSRCIDCHEAGHHWGMYGDPEAMTCKHCSAKLDLEEKCATCGHELIDHEFSEDWSCNIVVPDPFKDGRCICREFIIRKLTIKKA